MDWFIVKWLIRSETFLCDKVEGKNYLNIRKLDGKRLKKQLTFNIRICYLLLFASFRGGQFNNSGLSLRLVRRPAKADACKKRFVAR